MVVIIRASSIVAVVVAHAFCFHSFKTCQTRVPITCLTFVILSLSVT